MKPDKRTLEYDSNLGGEDVAMGVDDSAMEHVMSLLSEAYSDPELAVIREYATNALDSHREAGNDAPIEITLPSPLAPFFRVRDYGVGLDAEGIRNVYSRYGTSTKRDSNDAVGMLGIGCKSALAYCDQFTVTGVKDGRRIQVAVSRTESGGGTMTIVSDAPTTDPPGVEVVVPCQRSNQFERKAAEFFRFWEPGTVLVNSKHPARLGENEGDHVRWLDSETLLVRGVLDREYVVMGNVPYPLERVEGMAEPPGNSWKRVFFVPIGTVAFAPSREALKLTTKTKEALLDLDRGFQRLLHVEVSKQITAAATPGDAIQLYVDAREFGYKGTPIYKGHEVVTSLKRQPLGIDPAKATPTQIQNARYMGKEQKDADSANNYLVCHLTGYGRKTGDRTYEVTLHRGRYGAQQPQAWMDNFSQKNLSATVREKLRLYCEAQGKPEPTGTIVCVESMTAPERFWTEGIVYDWNEVAKVKIPNKGGITDDGRPRGSYAGRLPDGTWSEKIVADTIDTALNAVVWAQDSVRTVRNERHYEGIGVPELMPPNNYYLICLPANRVEKFKRDFPTAVPLRDCWKKRAAAWWSKLPKEVREGASIWENHAASFDKLRKLDPAQIECPDLKHAITVCKRGDLSTPKQRMPHMARFGGVEFPSTDPLKAYPLVQNFSGYGQLPQQHTYIYVNAVHAASEGATA